LHEKGKASLDPNYQLIHSARHRAKQPSKQGNRQIRPPKQPNSMAAVHRLHLRTL